MAIEINISNTYIGSGAKVLNNLNANGQNVKINLSNVVVEDRRIQSDQRRSGSRKR